MANFIGYSQVDSVLHRVLTANFGVAPSWTRGSPDFAQQDIRLGFTTKKSDDFETSEILFGQFWQDVGWLFYLVIIGLAMLILQRWTAYIQTRYRLKSQRAKADSGLELLYNFCIGKSRGGQVFVIGLFGLSMASLILFVNDMTNEDGANTGIYHRFLEYGVTGILLITAGIRLFLVRFDQFYSQFSSPKLVYILTSLLFWVDVVSLVPSLWEIIFQKQAITLLFLRQVRFLDEIGYSAVGVGLHVIRDVVNENKGLLTRVLYFGISIWVTFASVLYYLEVSGASAGFDMETQVLKSQVILKSDLKGTRATWKKFSSIPNIMYLVLQHLSGEFGAYQIYTTLSSRLVITLLCFMFTGLFSVTGGVIGSGFADHVTKNAEKRAEEVYNALDDVTILDSDDELEEFEGSEESLLLELDSRLVVRRAKEQLQVMDPKIFSPGFLMKPIVMMHVCLPVLESYLRAHRIVEGGSQDGGMFTASLLLTAHALSFVFSLYLFWDFLYNLKKKKTRYLMGLFAPLTILLNLVLSGFGVRIRYALEGFFDFWCCFPFLLVLPTLFWARDPRILHFIPFLQIVAPLALIKSGDLLHFWTKLYYDFRHSAHFYLYMATLIMVGWVGIFVGSLLYMLEGESPSIDPQESGAQGTRSLTHSLMESVYFAITLCTQESAMHEYSAEFRALHVFMLVGLISIFGTNVGIISGVVFNRMESLFTPLKSLNIPDFIWDTSSLNKFSGFVFGLSCVVTVIKSFPDFDSCEAPVKPVLGMSPWICEEVSIILGLVYPLCAAVLFADLLVHTQRVGLPSLWSFFGVVRCISIGAFVSRSVFLSLYYSRIIDVSFHNDGILGLLEAVWFLGNPSVSFFYQVIKLAFYHARRPLQLTFVASLTIFLFVLYFEQAFERLNLYNDNNFRYLTIPDAVIHVMFNLIGDYPNMSFSMPTQLMSVLNILFFSSIYLLAGSIFTLAIWRVIRKKFPRSPDSRPKPDVVPRLSMFPTHIPGWKAKLLMFIDQSTENGQRLDRILDILVLVNVVVLILGTSKPIKCLGDLRGTDPFRCFMGHLLWEGLNKMIVLILQVHYVCSFLVADALPAYRFSRWNFVFASESMIDLLGLLPGISLILGHTFFPPNYLDSMLQTNVFATMRCLRVLRILRLEDSFNIRKRVLLAYEDCKNLLWPSMYLALYTVYITGLSLYYAERQFRHQVNFHKNGEFMPDLTNNSILDTILLTVIQFAGETILIDFSWAGQIVVVLMCTFGITLFALPVAIFLEALSVQLEL